MKNLKKTKIIGSVVFTFLLVLLVVVSAVRVDALRTGAVTGDVIGDVTGGDLKCHDISGCTTEAGCGGPGTVFSCDLTCDNGSTVDCPEVEDPDETEPEPLPL